MEILTCKQAKEKNKKHYFTGKPCKYGHVAERLVSDRSCVMCNREKNGEDRRKEYYKNWSKLNTDKINKAKKKYVINNPEKIKEKSLKYYNKNKAKQVEYQRNKRRTDATCAIKCRVRALIGISIRNGGYIKASKTEKILGCSYNEFIIHLEKQFKKGMNWDNRSKWHIDHVVPLKTAKTEEEIIELNHFTNLRPIWKEENLSKGGKIEYLL